MAIYKLWTPSVWDRNRKLWAVHAITVNSNHIVLAVALTRKEARHVARYGQAAENLIATFVRKDGR